MIFFFIYNCVQWLIDSCLCSLQELKQYPSLRVEVGNAAVESLDRMKEESRKATLQLVEMENSYLTVDFFRKLPQDVEKGGNPTHSIFDRYNDSYLRRIGECKSNIIPQWFQHIQMLNVTLLLIVSYSLQEQPCCRMSIWYVEAWETPFQSLSYIAKSVRRSAACSITSSPT